MTAITIMLILIILALLVFILLQDNRITDLERYADRVKTDLIIRGIARPIEEFDRHD